MQQDRVRRAARELRLRDRGPHEIRTVLPRLQEGELHFQRHGVRGRQRVVLVRPLRGHELQGRQQRRRVPHRVGEELQHRVSTGKRGRYHIFHVRRVIV